MYKKILIFVLSISFLSVCVEGALPEPKVVCSSENCYRVLYGLGEGAFGKVFAVVDVKGQKYALKAFKQPDFDGPFADFLENAAREYEIGQKLNHPNIIKSKEYFYDYSQSSPYSAYLVLEFVEGNIIGFTPPKFLSVDEMNQADRDLSSALHYALSEGFVHFDLHLANIMLSEDKELKIIDLASFFTTGEYKALMEALMKSEEDEKSLPAKAKDLKKFIEEKKKNNPSVEKSIAGSVGFEFYLPHYFDRITDVNAFLLSKSDLSKEEKLDLRHSIKNIAWEYLYDREDGVDDDVEVYFDRLDSLFSPGD